MEAHEEILSKIIRENMREAQEKLDVGVYHASLLPTCLLRQYNLYLERTEISDKQAGIFKIGKLFHSWLQQTLQNMNGNGILIKAVEVEQIAVFHVDDDFIRLHCRADAIININNEDFILEIKTIMPHNDRLLPEQPLKHHVKQLQTYLNIFGIERGMIVYFEKKSMQHKIFTIKRDKQAFAEIVERMMRLHECLIHKIPPIPDPQDKWECKYCEFQEKCRVKSE
ncbi:MAG: PD-(D/E)XK nuclease family protein [Archaeoglobaceae archaeon]